jgi:hypothetical protein
MTRGKKKAGLGGLLLAGAAAFAYYKYSRMSEQDKSRMLGGLKEKGRQFYEDNLSGLLGKKDMAGLSTNSYQ